MKPVKQPNGRYKYNFMYQGKRYRKQGIATKKEAEAMIRRIVNDVAHGVEVDSNVLLADYFEQWYTVNKENIVSDKSLKRFGSTLKKIKAYFPDNFRLKDLDRRQYQEFLNHYAEGLTKDSVRKIHNPIHACMEDAAYHGLIRKNPAWKATIHGAIPAKQEKDKYIELDEYVAFKQRLMGNHTKSALLLFILHCTGARFSEINKLRRDNFNVNDNTVHLEGTKTENADRVISIAPSEMAYIMNVLDKWETDDAEHFLDISYNAAEKVFKHIRDDMGISENKTMYVLRHTHCSYLLANDVSINYIKERLGHANIRITMEYYGHLLKDRYEKDDRMATELMEAILQ